jgi:hypothetical protein
MSARVLFSAVALIVFSYIFPSRIFSQDELGIPKLEKSNDYWSIGYYASGNLSLINDYSRKGTVQPGYGGMLEFTYNNYQTELILLMGFNRINSPRENEHFETFEFSIGPRILINKADDGFIELTTGALLIGRVYKPEYWEFYNYPYYSDPVFRFGLSGALGKKFSVNNNTDILLKLRMLTTISFEGDNLTYMVLNGGVTFNTKKLNTKPKEDKISYVSITAFCGGTNPSALSQWDYDWGINYSGEVSYKMSPKVEFTLGGSYNKINRVKNNNFIPYKTYIASLTLSGRFYINESPLSAFIEFGSGLYNYHINPSEEPATGDWYGYMEEYSGMNVGTGTKIKLSRLFDFLLRTKLNFLFTGRYDDAPNYLTVDGGLRFNL